MSKDASIQTTLIYKRALSSLTKCNLLMLLFYCSCAYSVAQTIHPDTVYGATRQSCRYLERFYLNARYEDNNIQYSIGEFVFKNNSSSAFCYPMNTLGYNTVLVDSSIGVVRKRIDNVVQWRPVTIPLGSKPSIQFTRTCRKNRTVRNPNADNTTDQSWVLPDRIEFIVTIVDATSRKEIAIADSVGVDTCSSASSDFSWFAIPWFGTDPQQVLRIVELPDSLTGRTVFVKVRTKKIGVSKYTTEVHKVRQKFSFHLFNDARGIPQSNADIERLEAHRFSLILENIQKELDSVCQAPQLNHLALSTEELNIVIRRFYKNVEDINGGQRFWGLWCDTLEQGIEDDSHKKKNVHVKYLAKTKTGCTLELAINKDGWYNIDVVDVSGKRIAQSYHSECKNRLFSTTIFAAEPLPSDITLYVLDAQGEIVEKLPVNL